jgi:hypothetical protein
MIQRAGQAVLGQLPANLEAAVVAHKIGLLMIDPFVKSHGLEENLNSAIDSVAQVLSDLAAKHSIAIDVPHHISKGLVEPGNANRGRGASALTNALRLVYTLSPMSQEEAQTFNIPEDERRLYVRLDRAKTNVARVSGPAKWFRLVGVPLGNATALYPNGDEVQTVEPWTPPDTWAGLDKELLNRILTAIDAGMGDGTFYTAAPKATTRAAWRVVRSIAPEKTEGQAREIIRT